jgi:hypothetical protein
MSTAVLETGPRRAREDQAPQARPPEFTAERAAWIRDKVWPAAMRKTHRAVPRFYLMCACQHGLTSYCKTDQHEQCHRADPQAHHDGYITNRRDQVLYLTEAYEHPTTSATGPHYERAAMVWLADRVCRWVCPCTCHK